MVATIADGAAQKALPLRQTGGIRLFAWITDNDFFKFFILACIIANAVALGIDANYGEAWPYHHLIENLDRIFLTIFTVELALEFLAQGPRRFFRNGWNWFDMLVVGFSYVAMAPFISALRTLRILRVLRLVSAVPQMRRVVEALIGAMPGIAATFAVLGVVFYIGAVMATTLFHEEEGFENLGAAALTLFQLTQFDGWGDTINRLQEAGHPWAWAFLMGFTVIAAFAVLNLFIGVIVDAVQATRDEVQNTIAEDVRAVKEDVDHMRAVKEEIAENVEDIEEAQLSAVQMQKAMLEELKALRGEIASIKGAKA